MSVTFELEKSGLRNLSNQFGIIKKRYPEKTFEMIVKLLFDIKFLAQKKLRKDKHIVTSRLRNSIYVQTVEGKLSDKPLNRPTYTDKEGNQYKSGIDVSLKGEEGAIGTNVIYAGKIERIDSFIYWGTKHVNVEKRVSELSKDLLGKIK
jgi:hypothetical protein